MKEEISWIVVSDSKDNLERLHDYIQSKFAIIWAPMERRKLRGSVKPVWSTAGVHILCGVWECCLGYSLGYWLKKDGMEHLLDGAMFFEERDGDGYVHVYAPDDPPEGVLGESVYRWKLR